MSGKVVFVGAGPGDPELITVKGLRYLQAADVVVYAGSLVNPELLKFAKPGAELIDSSRLTFEEIVNILVNRAREGKLVVRLKSGDSHIYGALQEELDAVRSAGIEVEDVPGVSAFQAAAAAIMRELTLPGVSQTIIIARADVRSGSVPPRERLRDLASHGATMAIYTAVHVIDRVVQELLEGGYPPDTPVVVVYKASWPDQKIVWGTLSDIAEKVRAERITRTAVILVGNVLTAKEYLRSRVYDGSFTHSFRRGRKPGETSSVLEVEQRIAQREDN